MKPALLSFRIIVAILAIASAQIATAGEATERERIALKYNNPDLTVDLGVGLWGIPLPTVKSVIYHWAFCVPFYAVSAGHRRRSSALTV